jgi:hypothetical protein
VAGVGLTGSDMVGLLGAVRVPAEREMSAMVLPRARPVQHLVSRTWGERAEG